MTTSTPDLLPRPLSSCWLHWIAVPTGDQLGVMALLGLTDAVPASFSSAQEVIDADSHAAAEGLARVYVSPELDGWTLIIGRWCDPCDSERSDSVLQMCEELSARYGQAQAYYYGAQGDGSAWLVAERGTVVRRYCETGEGDDHYLTLGEPLRYECSRREHLGLATSWDAATETEEDEDEWSWETLHMAPEIAALLGVSPLALTAETPVSGTGVLARTPSDAS
ncbi:hypothetical protein ACIGKG_01605 [Streptomyces rochei]|uniref:Uncharacterized protein n=1 Tax=Streptomyces vinaceusdrappus TaxID=67376 RepID=A0ABY6BX53_9ACTN|nr:hypothetical protein [Streptomyces vinaceusdrappus]UXI78814.1 hypothetical protein N6Q81_12565 [Streptomyces vinaceusdrappus]